MLFNHKCTNVTECIINNALQSSITIFTQHQCPTVNAPCLGEKSTIFISLRTITIVQGTYNSSKEPSSHPFDELVQRYGI